MEYLSMIKYHIVGVFVNVGKIIVAILSAIAHGVIQMINWISNFFHKQSIRIKQVFHKKELEEPINKEPYEKVVEERVNLEEIIRLADILQDQMNVKIEPQDNLEVRISETQDSQSVSIMNKNTTTQNFCSIVGTKYLIKILTFHQSLERITRNYTLFICCIDDFIYEFLEKQNLENVVLIQLKDLETPELLQAKSSRTVSEYCWTIKAWLVSHIFEKYQAASVIYCDSDMYFFSDTIDIYKDWGEASLYLCLQRDVDWVERKYGVYQAGLIGFKNNEVGRNAANWWKNKCLEWCYFREDPEGERWGDQKYLDHMPRLFADTKISGHLGVDAAPWNIVYNNNYEVTHDDTGVFIDHYRLIAYHFSCIDIFDRDHFDLWNLGGIKINNAIKNGIYLPYIVSLRNSMDRIEKSIGKKISVCMSDKAFQDAKTPLKYSDFDLRVSKWDEMFYFCSIASEKYVIKVLTLYRSLYKQMENFHIWICCVDHQSYTMLKSLNLSNATLIPVDKIETDEIQNVRASRQLNEFCWTLKSVLCHDILNQYNIEKLLYCDADIYFFSHPKAIMDEWEGHSIYLIRQRAAGPMEKTNGIYQAGLIGFSKDKASFDVLKWWMEKCITWCYDNPDPVNERWGDQKYLDQVPKLFSYIKIAQNNGVNVAPWNIILNIEGNEAISGRQEKLFIGDDELIAYHFGSLLIFNEDEYDIWKWEPLNIDYRIMQYAYLPYMNSVRQVIQSLKELNIDTEKLFVDKNDDEFKNYVRIKKE